MLFDPQSPTLFDPAHLGGSRSFWQVLTEVAREVPSGVEETRTADLHHKIDHLASVYHPNLRRKFRFLGHFQQLLWGSIQCLHQQGSTFRVGIDQLVDDRLIQPAK